MGNPDPFEIFKTFGLDQLRPGKRRIVGAGFKMYLSYTETIEWMREMRARESKLGYLGVFVLPTFPALGKAREILDGSGIRFGAQDTHWEECGPYTGEVSPLVLREVGCTFVEIGHAERRALFYETDETVWLKTAAVLNHGLVPVVCVGEQEKQPIESAEKEVIRQVRVVLEGSVYRSESRKYPPSLEAIIIAYEPAWAIGKSMSAPTEYVAPITEAIRKELSRVWKGQSAVLYGGSVHPDEAQNLLAAGVDGLFVGRSALDLDEFMRILQAVLSKDC